MQPLQLCMGSISRGSSVRTDLSSSETGAPGMVGPPLVCLVLLQDPSHKGGRGALVGLHDDMSITQGNQRYVPAGC